MRVLVACEFSGVVREAFKARGHDAWSCDLLPKSQSQRIHYTSPGPDRWKIRSKTFQGFADAMATQ